MWPAGLARSCSRRRPTLTLFPGILPERDADVTSRAGVLGLERAFSSVENYYLLYAGRARAKSDLVNDAGIILMANERIENNVVPAYRSVVTQENLPYRRDGQQYVETAPLKGIKGIKRILPNGIFPCMRDFNTLFDNIQRMIWGIFFYFTINMNIDM